MIQIVNAFGPIQWVFVLLDIQVEFYHTSWRLGILRYCILLQMLRSLVYFHAKGGSLLMKSIPYPNTGACQQMYIFIQRFMPFNENNFFCFHGWFSS